MADSSRLSRRRFLVGVGFTGVAVALSLPPPAEALAPSNLENSISSAITAWAGRTGANGPAVASEVATIFGTEVSLPAAQAFTGFLRAGAIGLASVDGVLLLADLAHYLTTKAGGYAIGHVSKGGTKPSTIDQIKQDAGVNGEVVYTDGSTWAYIHYPYGQSTANGPPKMGLEGCYGESDGSQDCVWEANTNPGPLEIPAVNPWSGLSSDPTFTGLGSISLSPQSQVDIMNTLLDAANQAAPQTVPSPANSPFVQSDVAGSPLKASDLATPIPQTMQLSGSSSDSGGNSTGNSTTSNPGNTGSSGGNSPPAGWFDPASPPGSLADPGDLPFPSWSIGTPPPVSTTCDDPSFQLDLSGINLGQVTLTGTGTCQFVNFITPVIRPIAIAAVGGASVIATIADR